MIAGMCSDNTMAKDPSPPPLSSCLSSCHPGARSQQRTHLMVQCAPSQSNYEGAREFGGVVWTASMLQKMGGGGGGPPHLPTPHPTPPHPAIKYGSVLHYRCTRHWQAVRAVHWVSAHGSPCLTVIRTAVTAWRARCSPGRLARWSRRAPGRIMYRSAERGWV